MRTIQELATDITTEDLREADNIPQFSTWVVAALLTNAAMGDSFASKMTALYNAFVLGRLYERELGTRTFVVVDEPNVSKPIIRRVEEE